ncbi:penicillin-insensitive murein endopeptidase [Aestuariivirga litoralis]|uniref:penicillin-insensitive murein endopeptidase n=1 Tax=Aestuariivirga litoralis TaxID=2650924 RepID=UPI0018C7B0FF|nr:penicillin-insensitive murein endopeptidase [Aestuariivirga litoralis]
MPSVKNKLIASLLVVAVTLPVIAIAKNTKPNPILDLYGTAGTVLVPPAPQAAAAPPQPMAPAPDTADDPDPDAQATVAPVSTAPVGILKMPAKQLFGMQKLPAQLPPAAIGGYALGCMAGAQALPRTGPTWQIMRPSRNRNWGTPQLIAEIERLSAEAKVKAGWNGLLVGDMAQPRGGPMKTGHASHQIGLDADVWFTPMPDKELSNKERETMAPLEMVIDHKTLNRANWSESRAKLLQTVAQDPKVERIFMHPPIKAEMCRWAQTQPGDHSWLSKMRPLYGHTFHFHIRMKCPEGMTTCKSQGTPKPDDGTGCGKELAYWMSDQPWKKHPAPPGPPKPPPPPLTLASLPAECRAVIAAP